MKKITRILSLILAVAMVLSLNLTTITALADDYTITINNSTEDYEYEAYQIFDGDLSGSLQGSYVLSNITWGSGVDITNNETALLAALQAITVDDGAGGTDKPFDGITTAAGFAEVLTTSPYNGEDSELAKKFADVVGQYLVSSAAVKSQYNGDPDNNYTITVSDPGYYLVLNSEVPDDTTDTDAAYTRYILQVVGDVNVSPKGEVPTVEKKVYEEDYNSTAQEISDYGSGYNDVADYDIGDDVPFELIGTLPSNIADYSTYTYIFHDTMDSGLTLNSSSVTVYVDGNEISAISGGTEPVTNYTVATSGGSPETTDGCTFEVRFTNILGLKDDNGSAVSVTKDSIIVVKYTAKLNSDAVIGLDGNTNTVYLQYSNNPNTGGEGDTGETPKDKVIVFTYELDVTKVDGEDTTTALKDAEFVLYREVTEVNSEGTTEDVKYYAQVDDTSGKVTGWTKDKDSASTLKSGDDGTFKVVGLEDGTYYLEETKAPTGYNLLANPVTLIITATTVNGQSWGGTASEALTKLELTVNGKTTESLDKKAVSATVYNNKGATLPSTGGMGTKIFYTLGGLLVVCAGVLLIVKRRMRNA